MAKNPDNNDDEASVNKQPAAAAAATRFTYATLEMSVHGIPKCIVVTPSWSTRKASSLMTVVNPDAGSVESFLLHLLENSFTTQHLVELMKKYGSRLELFLGPNTRVALLPESELTSGLRKQHQANTHGDDTTSDAPPKDATLALTSQYRKTLTPVHLMMAREVHLKFDAVASLYNMIADIGETLKIVADKAPHHRHVVDKQTEEMRYILVPNEKKTAARKEAAAKKKEAAAGKTNGDKEEDAPAAKKARKEAPAAEADPAKKLSEDESSTTSSPSEDGSSSSSEEEDKGKPAVEPTPKSPSKSTPKKPVAVAATKTTPKSKAKKAKAKKGDESDNTQDEETPQPPPTPKSTAKKAKATTAAKSTVAKDLSATAKKSTQKKKNKRKRK
jgi:hypothetical protein